MNSLIILTIFSLFLIFGYLSFVSVLYRQQKNTAHPFKINTAYLLTHNDQQSLVFTLIPSISLLLFWGAIPALLWLLCSHLIIETLCNLILSKSSSAPPKTPSKRITLLLSICSAFIISACCSWVVHLLSSHSSILFVFIALLLALLTLQANKPKYQRIALSIVILFTGLLFSLHLNIKIEGQLTPLQILPWLSINHQTLLSIAIIYTSSYLTHHTSPTYKNTSLLTSNAIILTLVTTMAVFLIITPQHIEIPLHRPQTQPPIPLFPFICLILFTGLTQLLPFKQQPTTKQHPQTNSLTRLFISLIILITIVSQTSLSFWQTHYAHWSGNASEHFHYTIERIFQLLLKQNTFRHSFISHGLITLIAFVVFRLLKQNLSTLIKNSHQYTQKASAQHLSHALIILISWYFIHQGISLVLWITFSLTLVLTAIIYINEQTSKQSKTYSAFILFINSYYWLQSSYLTFYWFSEQHLIAGTITAAITLYSIHSLFIYNKQALVNLRQRTNNKLDL